MSPSSHTAQLQATEKPAGLANLVDGLWSDVWRRFKHNRIALAGFYVVCLLTFMAQHTRPQHTGDTTFSSRPST